MSTKTSKTPSTSQQAKRSCTGSDDSDTDHNSSLIFRRWLIIEAAEPEQPLSKFSPFVLRKALSAQIGGLKSVKRLNKGDILVETDFEIWRVRSPPFYHRRSFSPLLLPSLLPYIPSPPFPFLPLPSLPLEVGPLNPARGFGRVLSVVWCGAPAEIEFGAFQP